MTLGVARNGSGSDIVLLHGWGMHGAVWDDLVRIPAVILERKRAGEIYDSLRNQSIDPGLLQMGERGAAEASLALLFRG